MLEDGDGDRAEVAAADVVVARRAAGVHHQRAGVGQRVLEGEVNLVRPAGDRADGADRGMQHHGVARLDAELDEVARQLAS